MWTLSCYGPLCSKCLPDFSDYSPEEIRLEAYQCNIAGNPQSYVSYNIILYYIYMYIIYIYIYIYIYINIYSMYIYIYI